MLASLLRHLELWLSTAGLLVVWIGASVFGSADNVWHLAALLALGVSVLHGGIFWLVRRRQRTVRLHAIAEIREMMADRVKNQLAILEMYLPSTHANPQIAFAIDGIREAVGEITEAVDSLSDESLTSWKTRYASAIANGALAPA